MDINEIRETPIWALYEKGRNYHRMVGIYTDTDRNYRMYNGNQWAGAKLEVPFVLSAENKKLTRGDEIEVSEETLASIRKVNVNMVTVLGDAPEEEPKIPEGETEVPEEKSTEEAEEKKAGKPRTKKTEE